MMNYDYTPQIGYGPLKFGMTSAEIIDELGAADEQLALSEAAPWPDDVLKYVRDRMILTYRGEGKIYYEFTLYKEKLVSIALHNIKGGLIFDGIDLFSNDRAAVIDHFAKLEGVFFVNHEDVWFKKSGIITSIPEYWGEYGDKVVTFRLSSYEKQQAKFSDWEELDDPSDI